MKLMRVTQGLLSLISIFFVPYESLAQSTAAPSEFEVASVKPVKPGGPHGVWTDGSPNQIRMLGMSLKQLIDFGYGVRGYQVTGPDWIDSERYDVIAKVPSDAAALPEEARWVAIHQMTQALLAERFKVTLHRETKPLPVYALVVAKNGPKIRELGPDPGDNVKVNRSKGHLSAEQMPMSQFVSILASQLDRPVVDQTGIKGVFDVKLDWTPEPTAVNDKPDLFIAVQEQLGLKLEATKSSIEMLVIDHVERPSEN
jgi:uncharacterized protein (TIGR03435 family)